MRQTERQTDRQTLRDGVRGESGKGEREGGREDRPAVHFSFSVNSKQHNTHTSVFTQFIWTLPLVFAMETLSSSITKKMETKIWPKWDGTVPEFFCYFLGL